MKSKIEERLPANRAVITGCGSFVPAQILTNDDLSKMVETSDEWIVTRTGIRVRHVTSDEETTAYLATEAAKRALEYARYEAENVELIVVATITPEMVFPSTACFVQQALGARKAWAFDVAAACSGFVYSLHMVQQMMENGRLDSALVIGAETLTKITNWKDRTSCILFGAGAGVAHPATAPATSAAATSTTGRRVVMPGTSASRTASAPRHRRSRWGCTAGPSR